jgi:hypothetical protein
MSVIRMTTMTESSILLTVSNVLMAVWCVSSDTPSFVVISQLIDPLYSSLLDCYLTYNPDQEDADEDGIGDGCDEYLCDNCEGSTSGPCRQVSTAGQSPLGVCWAEQWYTGSCPTGTSACQKIPIYPCLNCWPGTSGPCQQSNTVCHELLYGSCPTGTSPCTE